MLGTPAGGDIAWTLAATAALVVVFAPLTMRIYAHQGRPQRRAARGQGHRAVPAAARAR